MSLDEEQTRKIHFLAEITLQLLIDGPLDPRLPAK